MYLTNCCNWATTSKCISRVTLDTTTDWRMVDHSTICIQSAWSWTRIYAFLVDASTIWVTFCTDSTFGSTIGCTSDHIRHARALCLSWYHLTLRVHTATWRVARVRRKWWWCGFFNSWTRFWFYERTSHILMVLNLRCEYMIKGKRNPAYSVWCDNQ